MDGRLMWTTVHQLPTHRHILWGEETTRFNLGLNVPQFSLRLHYFGNAGIKKPQNVICTNLAS